MGKRILLVEDDPAIRRLVTDLLADEGYDVTATESGRQGIDTVAAARPDLILLDKAMPDGDGTWFATEYRRLHGPRVPIIALCAARDGREWADSIGAAAYILKPFDIEALLGTVGQHLRERA